MVALAQTDQGECRVFIRHQRLQNSPLTMYTEISSQCLVAYDYFFFHLGMEPFFKYSPVMLHLIPATRILDENPENVHQVLTLEEKHVFWIECQ